MVELNWSWVRTVVSRNSSGFRSCFGIGQTVIFARDQVRPVQLRRYMRGKLALLHPMRGVHRIRRVRKEVAADGKKYLDLPLEHRMQSLNGVISPLLRRIEVELLRQRIQESLRWTLPDTHCAIALHI